MWIFFFGGYADDVRCFFFSSRRRHTRWTGDWSSDVCSSDLLYGLARGTSMFAVRSIEVEGATPALAAEVTAELHSFAGRSLVALNADAVAQRVDALAAVRGSVIDRSFPHTLRIRVLPEVP